MERVGSGLAFGTLQTPLRVDPSRLPSKVGASSVNDHDTFYSAGEAGGTGLKGKNERLSRKNANLPERLEWEND
jgi:hypothetical protein